MGRGKFGEGLRLSQTENCGMVIIIQESLPLRERLDMKIQPRCIQLYGLGEICTGLT